MRLYKAICFFLEAKATEIFHHLDDEPQPEGAGGSQVEHAHSFTTEPEMHSGWRPSHVGWEDRNHISLRWHPEG